MQQRHHSKLPPGRRGYSAEHVKDRHKLSPADAAKHAVRLSNFKKLFREFKGKPEELAIALELTPSRVEELLSGSAPITAELAMHIEDELHLPGGWLSDSSSTYPVAPAAAKPAAAATITRPSKPVSKQAAKPASKPAPTPPVVAKVTPPSKPIASKQAAKPAPKPAPKPTPTSVKSTSKGADSDEMTQRCRKMNLALLTEGKGEKAALARALGVHESLISMKLKTRPLNRDLCEKIEEIYKLKAGWMDSMQEALPEGIVRLAGDLRRGRPAAKPAAPAPAATPAAVPEKPAPAPAAAAAPTRPLPPTAAPAAATPTAPAPLAASGETVVMAKLLAEVITSRAASGALPFDTLVRMMKEVTG